VGTRGHLAQELGEPQSSGSARLDRSGR
jgi:hypothetical protein